MVICDGEVLFRLWRQGGSLTTMISAPGCRFKPCFTGHEIAEVALGVHRPPMHVRLGASALPDSFRFPVPSPYTLGMDHLQPAR